MLIDIISVSDAMKNLKYEKFPCLHAIVCYEMQAAGFSRQQVFLSTISDGAELDRRLLLIINFLFLGLILNLNILRVLNF